MNLIHPPTGKKRPTGWCIGNETWAKISEALCIRMSIAITCTCTILVLGVLRTICNYVHGKYNLKVLS